MTKDPETKEFMMIMDFADKGNLKSSLSNNFKNILWGNKILLLRYTAEDLKNLHELGYFHKDFHSGNILRITDALSYISDFGLSGPANEQKSDDKVYGVMPYIAPEVLNGEAYTSSSDIYSFGVVMAELSSYKCMDANSNERPTAEELMNILHFWDNSIGNLGNEVEKFGYKREEVKAVFKEADKEIPNISTSYEKNSDSVYTSRAFTFSKLLPKPVNSSIITSYINYEKSNEGIFLFKILFF